MIKILIVDDEYYFRQALKISLNWAELGFDICGEASNGKDALYKIHELQPDIVLVDINMPVMDGLELAHKVKDMGSNIKIIILTGYSEFNYAKQAVELGVNNYLLKPIDDTELEKSLLDIKSVIESEKSIKYELDLLKKQANENKPLLREKFLNDLITGNSLMNTDDLFQKSSYLEMKIDFLKYQVLTIEIDSLTDQNWTIKENELWKYAVRNVVEEIMSTRFSCNFLFDSSERICIIIGYTTEDPDLINSQLISKCDLILSSVQKYLKFTLIIGLGNVYPKIDNINTSYKESIYCLKSKLTTGSNRVILYNMIENAEIAANFYPTELRENILMSMRLNNFEEVNSILSRIFLRFKSRNIHPEIIYANCVELISTCFEFAAEYKQDPGNIFKNTSNLFNEIYQKNTLNSIESWVKDTFVHTISQVHINKKSKSEKLVNDIKNYICYNYQKPELRIDDIAKHFYLNYQYLCSIFKRETDCTLNEFITDFRIKKAKELIDSGRNSIMAIANEVGYEDSNYFSKCYKKHFGLSPSKYIENKLQ